MVTLEELQNASYDILCKVDDISKQLGLKLVLQSGTCLGAVRHDGFIPWDDDIDVMMPLKDYRKLRKYFMKRKNLIGGLSIADYRSDHETPHCLPRVRWSNSVVHEPYVTGLNINMGIWIDIFTYCYCAKNPKLESLQLKLMGLTFMMHEKYRNRQKVDNGNTEIMNNKIYKFTEWLPEWGRKLAIGTCQKLIELLGSKKSGRYFCLCDYITKLRTLDTRIFDDTVKHRFVDRDFDIPRDYDWYLSAVYGKDYMTPKKFGVHMHLEDVVIYK